MRVVAAVPQETAVPLSGMCKDKVEGVFGECEEKFSRLEAGAGLFRSQGGGVNDGAAISCVVVAREV